MHTASSLPPEFDRGMVTMVHQGDCHVSRDTDLTYSTVLGSCVSACVRDRAAGLGGMNHFLLAEPPGLNRDQYGASARYGAFVGKSVLKVPDQEAYLNDMTQRYRVMLQTHLNDPDLG